MATLLAVLKTRLHQRSFLGNVAMLAGATAGAQGLFFAASPLLTRIYTRQDFGLLALYTSIVSLIVVVASGRFEMAIPLPKEDDEAINLLSVALAVLGFTTAVVAAATTLFGRALLAIIHASQLTPYLFVVPVTLLAMGLYQVLSYWAVRENEYGLLSRTKMQQGFLQVVVQLVAGLVSANPIGLILGDVAGRSGGTTSLAWSVWRKYRTLIRGVSASSMRATAHRYRAFPGMSMLQALIGTANLNFIMVLLGTSFGPATVGLYALCDRVISIPTALIGTAVSQVFMGDAAERIRQSPGDLRRLVGSTTGRLLAIGAVPALLFVLFGPDMFSFLFGVGWREAGVFAATLAPMVLFEFAMGPLSFVFIVQERLSWLLGWDAVRFVAAICGSALLCNIHAPARTVVTFYSISMLLMYVALYPLALYSIRHSPCESA